MVKSVGPVRFPMSAMFTQYTSGFTGAVSCVVNPAAVSIDVLTLQPVPRGTPRPRRTTEEDAGLSGFDVRLEREMLTVPAVETVKE